MAKDKEEKEIVEVVKEEPVKAFIPVIYIGPNVPGGALARNSTFQNGYPKHVEAIREKHPSIAPLFVTIDEYPLMMHQLNSASSPIRQAEKAFVKAFNDKNAGNTK